jgi:hypothetical protein
MAWTGIEWASWAGLGALVLYGLYILKWAIGIDFIRHGGPHLPIPKMLRPLRPALAPIRIRLAAARRWAGKN